MGKKTTLGVIAVILALLSGCDDAPVSNDPLDQDAQIPLDAVAPTPDAVGEIETRFDLGVDPDSAPVERDASLVDADLRDAATAPPVGVRVQTFLGTPATPVGLGNKVTCLVWDADNAPVEAETVIEVRPPEGWRLDVGEGDITGQVNVVGEIAGVYSVQCSAPRLGLRDDAPRRWDVLAGPAKVTRITLDRPLMFAGETVEATCTAFDAFGNEVPADDAVLEVLPAGAGASVDGRLLTMTTSGRHRVRCALDGAQSEDARLHVLPDVPAALVAAVSPDLPVYLPGAVVSYDAQVIDQYGNTVYSADLVWSIEPVAEGFGEGRFLLEEEGRYTLTVAVRGPTFNDVELRAEAEVLVDAGGPAISCESPSLGEMIGMGEVALTGRIRDTAGLGAVTVDGREAPLDDAGRFSVDVQPQWGLNVHQIIARDAVGNSNSVFCAYFASDRYVGEAAAVADTIVLTLTQAAIDDGGVDNPIRSLGDLLRRVIDSPGLVNSIHTQLLASNPLLPSRCVARLPLVGTCLTRVGATYRALRIRGPNEVRLTLTNEGLRTRIVIRNLDLDGRIEGTFARNATFSVASVVADLTFRVGMRNGRPEVSFLRENEVSVGRMSADFDGWLVGSILDLVFRAFEGTVRDEVTSAMRSFLREEIDSLFDGVLGGLDVAGLGLEFEVPGLGGSPATSMAMQVDFSRLEVNPQRMLMGLSTAVTGPTRIATRSAGVALPPGPLLIEQDMQGSIGAAVNLTFVNQLLHRLWRAGLFTIEDAGGVGGLGNGIEFSLRLLTPPAVRGTEGGDELELHFGPAIGSLTYPGLFDDPLVIRLAAVTTVAVELVGDSELSFGEIQMDQMHLMIEGVSMSAQARAAVERDLGRVLQAVIDRSLSSALPALPVPDFALPDSLSEFGVPRGTRLGLREPTFELTPSHFLLDGAFSE